MPKSAVPPGSGAWTRAGFAQGGGGGRTVPNAEYLTGYFGLGVQPNQGGRGSHFICNLSKWFWRESGGGMEAFHTRRGRHLDVIVSRSREAYPFFKGSDVCFLEKDFL